MLTYMGVLKIYQITVFSSGSVQLCNNECPVRRPNFSINLLIYNLLVFLPKRLTVHTVLYDNLTKIILHKVAGIFIF